MSTVLAVQLAANEATFVTAKAEAGQPITLLNVSRVPRISVDSEEGEIEQEPVVLNPVPPEYQIDDTVGLVESEKIFYDMLDLPFRDPKKIEQVAPLQMQDSLPFDLDEFLIDTLVISGAAGTRTEGDNYRVLASLIPKSEVAQSLAFCASLGTEPRVITTGAAALAALARLCHADQTETAAYVELTRNRISLAVLEKGQALHFRDFPLTPDSANGTGPSLTDIGLNIMCSLARCERELGLKFEELYAIGSPDSVAALSRCLALPVKGLDLGELVINDSPDEVELEDISWSLGLFAAEMQRTRRSERQLVDFRLGQFAFHRVWQDIWSALQQELFYIVLALLLGVVWWGGKIYTGISSLHRVENRIDEVITTALPGEGVPYRGEVGYLQTKLETLEEELRGLGSLSSLSPLEALKELSIALSAGIDAALDSVSIGPSRILLRGSVAENRQVADLSAALKSRHDRFCDVKVDNKGKTANSRVGFTAELTLCE